MAHLEHLGYLFLGLLVVVGLKECSAQSYKAVVVPYKQSQKDLPATLLRNNVKEYVTIIQELKNQADIVVFPENGLTSIAPVAETAAHKMPYTVVLQTGKAAPFNEYILPNISSAAKLNEMYVVINVLEFDNTTKAEFFSTDVVYDPQGNLVAKCRKKYLYKERNYEKGSLSQDCTFEANFRRSNINVKFAILFDTDLLAENPDKFSNIRDAVLTSSLQNELPLPFGVSLQQGFAIKNNVNLLAAGYADSSQAYGGSGIYLRDGKSKVVLTSESLLQGDVPKDQTPGPEINVIVTPPNNIDTLENVVYRNLPVSSNSSYCSLFVDPEINASLYRWISFENGTNLLGQMEKIVACIFMKSEENKNQPIVLNRLRVVAKLNTNMIGQVLPLSLASGDKMVPANFVYKEERKTESEEDKTIITILSEKTDMSLFGILIKLKSGAPIHVSHIFFVSLLPLLSILWSKLVI